jgi:hypothetical protein
MIALMASKLRLRARQSGRVGPDSEGDHTYGDCGKSRIQPELLHGLQDLLKHETSHGYYAASRIKFAGKASCDKNARASTSAQV